MCNGLFDGKDCVQKIVVVLDGTATLTAKFQTSSPNLSNAPNLLDLPLSCTTSSKPEMTLSHHKYTNTEGDSHSIKLRVK